MEDSIKLRGSLRLVIESINGSRQERHVENLVVLSGRSRLLQCLTAGPQGSFTFYYIAIGTNGAAPTVADTSIPTYLANPTALVSIVSSHLTSNPPNIDLTASWATSFAPISNDNSDTPIREAALTIFNGFGGDLFAHATFAQLTVHSVDGMHITWTISG